MVLFRRLIVNSVDKKNLDKDKCKVLIHGFKNNITLGLFDLHFGGGSKIIFS